MGRKGTNRIAAAEPLYKVLVDGCSVHGGSLEWSLPENGKPGEWHEVEGDIQPCANGLHLTKDPSKWWRGGGEVYVAEFEGPMIEVPNDDKVVVRKARLVRRLAWAELTEMGLVGRRDETKGTRSLKQPAPPAKGPSPAMQLVRCVWENRCSATPHSWRTVNASMSDALSLAITSGLSFAKEDIGRMFDGMRGGYWVGENADRFYSAAIECGNLQACQSFEAWADRKPFMWEGKRLHIGSRFDWEGQSVKVTSFQDGAGALVACSYKPGRDPWNDGPIARRFTITNEQLAKAEKDRKVEKKIEQDVSALQTLLKRCNLNVLDAQLARWTPEERAAAAEWAQSARQDVNKKRVRPEAPPACLTEAAANVERDRRAEEARECRRRVRSYREDIARAQRWLSEAQSRLDALSDGDAEEPD